MVKGARRGHCTERCDRMIAVEDSLGFGVYWRLVHMDVQVNKHMENEMEIGIIRGL